MSDNAAHENDIIELLKQMIQQMEYTMTEISMQSRNVLKEHSRQLQSTEEQNKVLNVQLSNVSLSVQDLQQKLSDLSSSKETLDQTLQETVLVLDEKLMQPQSLEEQKEGQNKSLSMQLSISSQSGAALQQELQDMEREHEEKSMQVEREEREHKEKSMQVHQWMSKFRC